MVGFTSAKNIGRHKAHRYNCLQFSPIKKYFFKQSHTCGILTSINNNILFFLDKIKQIIQNIKFGKENSKITIGGRRGQKWKEFFFLAQMPLQEEL